jgi:superoxide dismutase
MSKPFLTCYGLWCSLGTYRGIQDYNKKYDKDYKFYLEKPNSKKPIYYYSDFISSSLLGLLVYANPILLPIFGYYEIVNFEKIIRGISKYPKGVRDNAGGAFNHALFWNMLSPQPQRISKELLQQIKKDFGTFEKFKKQFEEVAIQRFGSGWVWLILTNKGTLKIMSTPNQDNPLMNVIEGGGYPILGLDLWEHAYYLKYKNKRDEYIKNFWTVVNWDFVGDMYTLKTQTKLLESQEMGKILMETKSESCTRGEVEFFRVLFNNNLRARDIYKNTINDIIRNLFADNYHNKSENGEIPGVYDLEKPGRSVINYMNTNYSVFCIMVRDLNRVITKSLKEKSVNFEGKTPAEQISEMKRLCNYIEQFSSRIFDPNSQTFHSIMNTLREKDNVGTRRENMAQVRLQESIPNAKVIVTAGAGKTKDAIQKIDMEIVVENSKLTAQVKGFDEILEQNGRLVVTKTGEVAKYNVDWMVFVKGKKVVVFENKGEIVMGNYVFEKTQMIYDLR